MKDVSSGATCGGGEIARLLAEVARYMQVGLYVYRLEDPQDDRSLRMVATNEAATAFTGVPMQDVLGKTLDENFPGLRAKCIPQIYAEVARSGERRELEDLYYGDDRVLHGAFSVHAFPLPDHHVGVVFENITQRKHAELALREAHQELERRVQERTRQLQEANEALEGQIEERKQIAAELRQSQEKHENLFLTMAQGVVYQDALGRITSANPAAEAILGLTFDQMRGRTSVDPRWRTIHEDGSDFPGEEHPAMRALQTGEPVRDVVIGVYHPEEKRHRWLLVSAVPRFRPGEEEPFEVFATFTDITERKQAAAERRKIARKIQQTQKLESLGVLAGGIAHDFNNLLMGVMGNTDLALLDLERASSARPFVEDIRVACSRLAELTRQMLAYSGQGRFEDEVLDLSGIVEEMAHLLNASIPKKVALEQDLADDLPAIRADATQIRQVVMNLITNAAEACAGRSGTVSLRTGVADGERVRVSDRYVFDEPCAGSCVFLEVADTGCGMDDATRERIFDPFYSTKFTGRGLGLAAVLGIVRGHGGAIEVRSAPDQGTTVTAFFPHAAQEAARPAAPPPQSETWTGEGTILLVDDEQAVLKTGRMLLERLGFSVLCASDGHEALLAVEGQADSLRAVLLDMTMPKKDGLETLVDIQRSRPDLPVILCSGYSEQEANRKFAGHGLVSFLQKPYGLEQLSAKLQDALATAAD